MLNHFQQTALQVYAQGDFVDDVTHPDDVQGDTLLKFVLIELSDTKDCEDRDTAIQRMESAICDLTNVVEALEKLDEP